MQSNRTLKLIYAALFAALIFVGTQFIRIPLPFGYFNLGDCFILLAALLIGGKYAIAASAIGASLADILSGYTIYAPATFVVKALMVWVMILILKKTEDKGGKSNTLWMIIATFVAEVVMVCGYFLYDGIIYSFVGAIVAMPGNLLQGVVAVVIGNVLVQVFERSGVMKYIKLS